MREAEQFDVIHAHLDYQHLPLFGRTSAPALTTLHGRLDLPHWPLITRTFRDARLARDADYELGRMLVTRVHSSIAAIPLRFACARVGVAA